MVDTIIPDVTKTDVDTLSALDENTRLFVAVHQLDALSSRGLRSSIPDSVSEQLDGCPTSSCNIRIISYLAANQDKPIYQHDIERHCGVTRSTASRVLNLMEQKGLVKRHIPTYDARKRQITLTDKSRNIVQYIEQFSASYFESIVDGIPQEDLETTLRTIKTMISRMSVDE